jgi:WD40 repeat protein
MDLDLKRNYLFTGGFDDGELAIFDIDKPNREKYAKQVASLQGKEKVRSIAWIPERSELAVGTADGSITFWNAIRGKSLCILFINVRCPSIIKSGSHETYLPRRK